MQKKNKGRIFLIVIAFAVIISIAWYAVSVIFQPPITGAFMINGYLYVKAANPPEELAIHQLLNSDGKEESVVYEDVQKSNTVTDYGFYEYNLTDGADKILFEDGKYEIQYQETFYPVISIWNCHVDSGKRTVNQTEEFNDNEIKFCDYVYPVIYNHDAYKDITFSLEGTQESLNPKTWPKILRDGLTEKKENGMIHVTYPKEANTQEPTLVFDVHPKQTDGSDSLDQGDRLTIKINRRVREEFFWDQIGKLWNEKKTDPEIIEMVYVEGGHYLRGDWQSAEQAMTYTFGSRNMNMKKLWLNIMDPQYMGEKEVGEAAVGVTGLNMLDSLAADENSDMWITNEDSTTQHQVQLSDFMLGKYEVTMDQFYRFVEKTEIVSPSEITYHVNNETYTLNQVASYSIYNKKNTTRDNGWGKGERPAIDINWYEAVEFCNYLSRKEELEPCYTFTNVYNGQEGDGLTQVKFLDDVYGSVMQKKKMEDRAVQLVKVDCDFTKSGYRLPTESEYEYAARGGKCLSSINEGKGHLYSGLGSEVHENSMYYSWMRVSIGNPQLSGEETANLQDNNMGANGYTNPVGTRLPNGLGIYDMSGNVWEQCWDFYNYSYYGELAKNDINIDPHGPEYTLGQLSVMDSDPVDPYMENQYQYTYEYDENGLGTRVSQVALMYSGKLSHTLRGGCFTNPYVLTTTVNRFGPAQIYVQNCINFTDSRVGMRLARTVTANDN